MEKRLLQSEIQFKALFQFASEGILVANKEGEILIANPAVEGLFGYDKGELDNKKIEILLPKKLAHQHIQSRSEFNENPKPRSMGSGRDLFAVKKDGSEFPVEVSLSPFTSEEGEFVIAFIIDISIRKKLDADIKQQKIELEQLTHDLEKRVKDRTMILEEALQQLEISREELSVALDKEKELNEMKSRFVSMASHEFRTPLATILSSLSLVSKYGEIDEKVKQQKHIERIKDSIKHLTDLLNDVLSISKLEEGKTSITIEAFDITSFITEIIRELRLLTKRDQKIAHVHSGETDVFLDKKGLRIIFFNLISNAIKFSPSGSIIEVNTSLTNNQIQIQVKDHGLGISKEDQVNLFQRFFRGANVTNIQGTGLGLSIIARYIELMDGTIDVESVVNEGTTFNIALPNNLENE